jgi:hypothetical protein
LAYLGNRPAESFASFEKQVFTIVNSQTAYTLSHSVVNENDIRLVVNNVVQEPGSGKAYTASGTTLTLSAALTNGTDTMYCVFLGRALQTVNPPNASVGTAQLASEAVTNAKVASTVITGQTAETSIATDDTILIHDTSASALRKMTRANFVSGIGGTNTPAFRAYFSGNVSVGAGSDTVATFNAEDFDTDSAFNTSTYRFIPQTAGKYYLYVNIQVASATNGNLYVVYLRKNGVFVGRGWHAPGSSNTLSLKAYTTQTANGSTDYFDVVYYFADAKTANGGSDESEFGGYKLIGV